MFFSLQNISSQLCFRVFVPLDWVLCFPKAGVSMRSDSVKFVKVPNHFPAQSNYVASCYGKPVERSNEIKGYVVSLVRCTGFL